MTRTSQSLVYSTLSASWGSSPSQAGLHLGDRVVCIGETATENNDAVKAALDAAQGAEVEVIYIRSGEQLQTTLTPAWDATAGQWRAGMWVRDSSAGVGTLTFADEEKGVFAGLGHPISDSDTGESIALRSGEIVPCQITGCSKGTAGSPGELKGRFLSAHAIGTIRINGENGVYGSTRAQFAGQKMEVAFAQEVEAGNAEIWTTTSGETPRAYRVKIEKISDADPRRNMVLRVGTAGPDGRHRAGDEREPHRAERPPGGGSHPCAGQRPHPGVRHLCADHAGTGRTGN